MWTCRIQLRDRLVLVAVNVLLKWASERCECETTRCEHVVYSSEIVLYLWLWMSCWNERLNFVSVKLQDVNMSYTAQRSSCTCVCECVVEMSIWTLWVWNYKMWTCRIQLRDRFVLVAVNVLLKWASELCECETTRCEHIVYSSEIVFASAQIA